MQSKITSPISDIYIDTLYRGDVISDNENLIQVATTSIRKYLKKRTLLILLLTMKQSQVYVIVSDNLS